MVEEKTETEKENAATEEIKEEPEATEETGKTHGNRGWTASSGRRFF